MTSLAFISVSCRWYGRRALAPSSGRRSGPRFFSGHDRRHGVRVDLHAGLLCHLPALAALSRKATTGAVALSEPANECDAQSATASCQGSLRDDVGITTRCAPDSCGLGAAAQRRQPWPLAAVSALSLPCHEPRLATGGASIGEARSSPHPILRFSPHQGPRFLADGLAPIEVKSWRPSVVHESSLSRPCLISMPRLAKRLFQVRIGGAHESTCRVT